MIRFEQRGRLGLITIDRPEALGAMNAQMAAAMLRQLRGWQHDDSIGCVAIQGTGKAFCAGGDIRAVYEMGRDAMRFFEPEYDLCRAIRAYPKPYVALMDGITFGGGVGISIYGSHRIATANTLWAMPECAIGFYPDIGATWFLPRLAGETGTWLALTGARLRADDLLALAIANGFTDDTDALLSELEVGRLPSPDGRGQGEGTDYLLQIPSPALTGTLSHLESEMIGRCFAFDTVEEIMTVLENEPCESAAQALAAMRRAAPTSLKVTLRQMRLGKTLSFDRAIDLEFALTRRFLERPDFSEGVRAALIDRDSSPRWHPPTVDDVGADAIDLFFSRLLFRIRCANSS